MASCGKRVLQKQEKSIVAYSAGGYVTEIDFALVEKKHKVSRECKSDCIETPAPVGGRRPEQKDSWKKTDHEEKDVEVECKPNKNEI